MHRDEIWQVYNRQGEPIPGKGWNARLGNPEETGDNSIVGVAPVFLYRRNAGGELEFLWQRRSFSIDRYPGDFDFSAGGHVNLGESMAEAAVREAYEEIGAQISKEDLRLVFMRSYPNRIATLFAVDFTGRKEDFSFRDAEVSEVRWVAFSEMEDFRKSFAKEPLKKDDATFLCLQKWFSQHENI